MLNLLLGFEQDKFPTELCTVDDGREKNVRNCTQQFICAVWDSRFKDCIEFRPLYPFVSWDEETFANYEEAVAADALFFGWGDKGYMNCWDHKVRDLHGDHHRVVAWKVAAPEDLNLTFEVSK